MLSKLPKKLETFKKIWEKLLNSEKKIVERLKIFLGSFTLDSEKVCRKSVEFQN